MSTTSLPTTPTGHPVFNFDRHAADYRENFLPITEEMQSKCPMAWSDTHGGHWVAAGSDEVFELARSPNVSNDHDVKGDRSRVQGHHRSRPPSAPTAFAAASSRWTTRSTGITGHSSTRTSPRLRSRSGSRSSTRSCRPASTRRSRAGRIDFVDDLANIVPAVLTLAMIGIPIEKWTVYYEPVHAAVYTPPDSPDIARIDELHRNMGIDLLTNLFEIRENPRPGLINAIAEVEVASARSRDDMEMLRHPRPAHRRRLRHHHRADRARTRMARARIPTERTRLSDERDDLLDSRHRGVPALLHSGAR